MVEVMQVKIGCCGFAMDRRKYYGAFPVVEVQQTFYQLPRAGTAARWRAEAPPAFEFTMKAWQLITHEPSSPTYRRLRRPLPPELKDRYGSFRPTDEVEAAWAATAEVAGALGARIVLFQCPPRFTPTEQHVVWLRQFFVGVARGDFVLTWEPRGEWPPHLVAGLCAELGLVHVGDPLAGEPLTKGLRYFRLHGVTGYRYIHSDEDLAAIAKRLAPETDNYVLFNNQFMAEDAVRFQALLQKRQRSARPARRSGR